MSPFKQLFAAEMVTPADIQQYTAGNKYHNAVGWLTGSPEDIPRPIPRDLHAFLRNHLIIAFIIGNAARSGGIAELTVEQFQAAKYFAPIDQHVMKVHQ